MRSVTGSIVVLLGLNAVLGIAVARHLLHSGAAPSAAKAASTVFEVRTYGAKGDGRANDTPAINNAIAAANDAGGGVVHFPPGTYLSANSIHLQSNVTLRIDRGATIKAAGGNQYDKAESNPYDMYQDFGHSHFHDAMIWGDRLTNVGITGSGTIDGDGRLATDQPAEGQADKIISLTRCKNLTLSGITLRRGGHFAALINGCDHVTSNHLTIDTATERDGWNIISSTNVLINGADIASNDDALAFKSDYALGTRLPSGHVSVLNSRLSARCCNALMFGSETCGDFTDYHFTHITITGAGQSGLGMVSMDGATISGVHYNDITMSGVRSPIMQKIGTRRRCGDGPGIGHIRDVTYTNVRGTAAAPAYTAMLWGQPGGNRIDGVALSNVHLTVPGGNGPMSADVPHDDGDYHPYSVGTRPAYGWYLHNANHVRFIDSSVRFRSDDRRPAVIADNAASIAFYRFSAQRGRKSPADLVFQDVAGYCVAGGREAAGRALRVRAAHSTRSCGETS